MSGGSAANLAVELAGVRFQNPVWVASGTFGYGDDFQTIFDVSRLGAVVTKTLFLGPRDGNPPPRIAEVGGGMLNSIGLANIGWEAFRERKAPWLRQHLPPAQLVVNVAGNTAEEYREVALRVDAARAEVGAAALELNISCPNVNEGGTNIGCDLRLTREVLREVRAVTSLPLLVKLSPNNADLVPFARLAEEEGADGVSLINTLYGMTVDLHSRRPFLGHGSGGLSGPSLLPVGVFWTYKVHQAVRIPIVGIGGIARAEDALQYLMAGARAVQVGTASFLNPFASLEVIDGIARFLDRHRMDLEELIGVAHERRPQNVPAAAAAV
ncbi:MAG: dihydroorotate dehydrogenase [Gemmatimonadetes bacterium]|nr:dihydroorotate dehydrogenase [Gemmatimonadota bacterium]